MADRATTAFAPGKALKPCPLFHGKVGDQFLYQMAMLFASRFQLADIAQADEILFNKAGAYSSGAPYVTPPYGSATVNSRGQC
jgi:hypothetical protein